MDKKCTATVLDTNPRCPSEDVRRECGKDAEYLAGVSNMSGLTDVYLCEKHYQEWLSND